VLFFKFVRRYAEDCLMNSIGDIERFEEGPGQCLQPTKRPRDGLDRATGNHAVVTAVVLTQLELTKGLSEFAKY